MWPFKTIELLLDCYAYSFLQWYYMVPNMMARGTDADQWISTFCMNGIKRHQGNGKLDSTDIT